MIEVDILRSLGWSEDLISEVNRCAEGVAKGAIGTKTQTDEFDKRYQFDEMIFINDTEAQFMSELKLAENHPYV